MDNRVPAAVAGDAPALKRSISMSMIVLYGLGTTIGAGIYVLIGKVAAVAGLYMPVAFIIASILAVFTVFSFAELAARFPMSAGEAVYLHEAFGIRWLSLGIGLSVMFAGLISAAAISRGFVGYLHEFALIPEPVAVIALVASRGALAAWGITESITVAVFATLLEIGGLVFVLWASRGSFAALPDQLPALLPSFQMAEWSGILAGAILAFYAFIGFEDMVNVAEEVTDVRRNLPRAMILTLTITSILYIGLALAATLGLPIAELASSDAPLALLVERHAGASAAQIISAIALVAVLNGALIQIVMAARVVYGLAMQQWLPACLASIHPYFRTPLLATALTTGCVMVFALWLPLATLAEVTSFLTLFVFAAVNFSLFRIQRRSRAPEGIMTVPAWVPVAGFVASVGVIILRGADMAFSGQ